MATGSVPSVRSRINQLAAVFIVPALLIVIGLLVFDYHQARAKLIDHHITTARAMTSLVDKDFASVEATLRALATSPAIADNDLQRFYEQAQEMLSGQIENIVLSDPQGNQVFNTLRPFGAALPPFNTPATRQLLSDRKEAVVSGLFTGKVSMRPMISITVPVWRDNRHVYNLSAGISPWRLNTLLSQQQLPDDWITAILDENNVIVSRTHEMSRFMGRSAAPNLGNALATNNEGYFYGSTSEGVSVLGIYSRSPATKWSVAIGLPTSSLNAALWRQVGWLALGAIVLFALSLAFARTIAKRLARSVTGLIEPALALGEGEKIVMPALDLREADEVGKALTRASRMLEIARYQANHDVLTGLANRGLFQELVNSQLALAGRNGTHVAVLFIDLDGFKEVNDTYGHAAGDDLLYQASTRLRASVRESDVVARLGGDEFAVMLISVLPDKAEALAQNLLETVSAEYDIAGKVATVSASIGVACYPESGATMQELLFAADTAMYKAKQAGKRQVILAQAAHATAD
ncbi:diguanylate cyclase (GGDEF) domain-containing protein [Noviherbaspirillum humi]|uniref:Diguanylate cyclase (GGDEF) domain-containing protein n=1 Tax=Noviherbaspirillum humi TaxID=1688639 RepID=A0A239EVL7_9BURK|nr:sensor domain-containing diguanylate cyclase [Noviherbaspirillum humi]SNS48810.1 diguanylate cyclase (GGDEF) domain-containing protein [Noviherbaspirillum humi]